MKRLAGIAAAALVTIGTLAYALWDVDLDQLRQTLMAGRLWVIPPFLVILGLFYYSNALRWRLLLRPFGRFGSLQLMPSMMIGFAANNLLPLRVGELIRAHLLAREQGLSRSGILMNLVLERLLDLIAILAFYVAGLALLPEAPAAFRTSAWVGAAAILGLGGVLLCLLFLPQTLNRTWLALAARLPDPVRQRGSIYLEQFAKGLAPLRQPLLAAALLAQSIGRWCLPVALAWLAVYAYAGAIPLALAMITVGITAFAVSLPSAPGFVGPMQAAFVLALTPFGVTQEAALAASLLFLLGHWIPVTGVGVLLLASRHRSFRELALEADKGEKPAQ